MSSAANHKSILTGILPSPIILPIEKRRYLTSFEKDLARLIFKDSIIYDKVYIVRGGLYQVPTDTGNAMTPWGNIHLPANDYDRIKDFSLSNASDQIWFIHEMTHVWQFSLKMSPAIRGIITGLRGGYHKAKAYRYDLKQKDKNKKFYEFNFEQQADILSHYFDAVYLSDVNHDLPTLHQTNLAQYRELVKVLDPFIKEPKNPALVSKVYGNF